MSIFDGVCENRFSTWRSKISTRKSRQAKLIENAYQVPEALLRSPGIESSRCGFDREGAKFLITKPQHANEIENTRGFDSFADFAATCILGETLNYAHTRVETARRFGKRSPHYFHPPIPSMTYTNRLVCQP